MLAVVGGVVSLSEPDIYSVLSVHNALSPAKVPPLPVLFLCPALLA